MNSIGAMRHRITIEKKITGETENGFSIEVFESVATVWAEVKSVQNREYEKADTTQNEARVRFQIRYLAGLNSSMEIIFADDRYEIISIENQDFKNRYLEIIGRKVSGGG
jgi:SPP1 family predicted phage head-tail adaptor